MFSVYLLNGWLNENENDNENENERFTCTCSTQYEYERIHRRNLMPAVYAAANFH